MHMSDILYPLDIIIKLQGLIIQALVRTKEDEEQKVEELGLEAASFYYLEQVAYTDDDGEPCPNPFFDGWNGSQTVAQLMASLTDDLYYELGL